MRSPRKRIVAFLWNFVIFAIIRKVSKLSVIVRVRCFQSGCCWQTESDWAATTPCSDLSGGQGDDNTSHSQRSLPQIKALLSFNNKIRAHPLENQFLVPLVTISRYSILSSTTHSSLDDLFHSICCPCP